MIRTVALTKWFGSRKALDDFEVEIGPRRVVGFLGLNGAGKTTTLRMLAGLMAPSSGHIFIGEAELTGPNGHMVRSRIGFLPDRPPVYEDMRVADYVAFAAKLRGHSGSPTRVEAVLERLELSDRKHEAIGELSHGYRQRVGLAQAIVHEPDLVLLDEPTTGLDPKQIQQMRSLVRRIAEDHTVILSSHNLHEVEETCDEVLLVDEGRLVAQGSPDELRSRVGETRTLRLDVVGSSETLHSWLAAGSAADHWPSEPELESEGELHTLVLQPSISVEAVARSAVEAKLGLRRLEPVATGLEGLFAQLTRPSARSEVPS